MIASLETYFLITSFIWCQYTNDFVTKKTKCDILLNMKILESVSLQYKDYKYLTV